MQQGDMGIPGCARVDSRSEGVICGEAQKIRGPLVDEEQSAGRRRVPGVRRNYIERGLQPRLGRLAHYQRAGRLLRANELPHTLQRRARVGHEIRNWRSRFLTHRASGGLLVC